MLARIEKLNWIADSELVEVLYVLAGVVKEHEQVVPLDAVCFLVGRFLLALRSFGLPAHRQEVDLALQALSFLARLGGAADGSSLSPSLRLTVVGAGEGGALGLAGLLLGVGLLRVSEAPLGLPLLGLGGLGGLGAPRLGPVCSLKLLYELALGPLLDTPGLLPVRPLGADRLHRRALFGGGSRQIR